MANNEKKIESKEEKKANKKPNLFTKIGNLFKKLGEKLKGLKAEWKKISWASPKSTFKNFLLVLVIVICFAIALAVIDTVCGLGVVGINTLGNKLFPELTGY